MLDSTYISQIGLGNDETKATPGRVRRRRGRLGQVLCRRRIRGSGQEGSVNLNYVEEKRLKFFTSRHVVATQGRDRLPRWLTRVRALPVNRRKFQEWQRV
jgi:hypothetical protein